jgi:chemotaxis protein histidine kinase CheA
VLTLRVVCNGDVLMSDPFTERLAAVRERFVAKFDARIGDIESAIPQLGREVGLDTVVEAHRQAHGLCGIGPSLGYVETGKVARSIERMLLAAVKDKRPLADDEIVALRGEIVLLRSTAAAEMSSACQM